MAGGLRVRHDARCLLRRQPLELGEELASFAGKPHRQVFGRVKLLPVPGDGEITQSLGQFADVAHTFSLVVEPLSSSGAGAGPRAGAWIAGQVPDASRAP